MSRYQSSMVVLAIFVSRFEASVIASMLRGYGIHVLVDGDAHASVEFISLALGGHRLIVMRDDYELASDILRQAGVENGESIPAKPCAALLKFVALVIGLHAAMIVPGVISGAMSALALFYVPFAPFTMPVDPKGRPDYFLAETAE